MRSAWNCPPVLLSMQPRQPVDSAQANIVAAEGPGRWVRGELKAAEAQILGSQAAVEKAQLNLGFTKVTSPVDGSPESRRPDRDLVGPGSVEELTTVSTIDPIKCYVSLSEQEYMRARRGKDETDRQGAVGAYPLGRKHLSPQGEVAFAVHVEEGIRHHGAGERRRMVQAFEIGGGGQNLRPVGDIIA